jgi:hypothetical protein
VVSGVGSGSGFSALAQGQQGVAAGGELIEHGVGALGHGVRLQDGVVAVVADGVEVAVEPGLADGQPELPQAADQAGEQGLVGLAAYPVGVGAQVGGLGQGRQAGVAARPRSSVSDPTWWLRGRRAHSITKMVSPSCGTESSPLGNGILWTSMRYSVLDQAVTVGAAGTAKPAERRPCGRPVTAARPRSPSGTPESSGLPDHGNRSGLAQRLSCYAVGLV